MLMRNGSFNLRSSISFFNLNSFLSPKQFEYMFCPKMPQDCNLVNAVTQLISENQPINGFHCLWTEVENQYATTGSSSSELIINCIIKQASSTGQFISDLIASVCAARISYLLAHELPPEKGSPLLQDRTRTGTLLVLEIAKEMDRLHGMNYDMFIASVVKLDTPPIELLWLLYVQRFMSLDKYIERTDANRTVNLFSHAILQICEKETDSSNETVKERKQQIVNDLMKFIALGGIESTQSHSSANFHSKHTKEVCVAIADQVAQSLFQKKLLADINLYDFIDTSLSGDTNSMKKFCTRQISIILTSNPIWKVSEAIEHQSKWTFSKTEKSIINTFIELLLPFSCDEAIVIQQQVLEQQEVNWKSLLAFTSVLAVIYTESSKIFKVFLSELITKGLEQSDMESLIMGFLLARQVCYEGPCVFPPYSDWFYETFGNGTRSPANNKKNFTFLMKFLTDIVPFETSLSLKAHLTRTPFMPLKCREVFSDYILLAKTRLADLKESFDDGGIYSGQSTDGAPFVDHAEDDVSKALNVFGKTGRLPTNVMEASIFRRPYFHGKFLKALLLPRQLPDTPDTRMLFIQSLSKAGKIPVAMMVAYEKACQKEADKLLEGAFNKTDDTEMDDLLLSPLDQLKLSLSAFTDAITTCDDKDANIHSHISNLSEKIRNIFRTEDMEKSRSNHLNLNDFEVTENVSKAVDAFFLHICDTLTRLSQSGWLSQMLSVALKEPGFCNPFLVQLWNYLTYKGTSLTMDQCKGVSAILLHLESMPLLSSIKINFKDQSGSLLQLFLSHMFPSNLQVMNYLLRFCTWYIFHGVRMFNSLSLHYVQGNEAVVPTELIKLFLYLMDRFTHHENLLSNEDSLSEVIQEVMASKKFQSLRDLNKVTLKEWLKYEADITLESDGFCGLLQRQHYYTSMANNFMALTIEHGGCDGSYRVLSTAIMSELLLHRKRISTLGLAVADHQWGLLQLLLSLIPFIGVEKSNQSNLLVSTGKDANAPGAHTVNNQVQWLQECLKQVIHQSSQGEENSDSIHLTLELFFSITSMLPGYLYFVDTPCKPVHGKNIENARNIIDCHMKEYSLIPGLSQTSTLHIIQGLSVLQSPDGSVFDFVTTSQTLNASIVIHAKSILSWIRHCQFNDEKLQRYIMMRCQLADSITDISLVVNSHDDWLIGVALFSKFVQPRVSDISKLKIILYQCMNIKKTDVLDAFVSCLLCHQQSEINPQPIYNVRECLKLCRESIFRRPNKILLGEIYPNQMKGFVSSKTARYFSIFVAEFLLEVLPNKEAQDLQLWHLESILQIYIKCGSLYDEYVENEEKRLKIIPSVSLLMKLSKLVRRIISKLPNQMVQSISKVTLEQLSPDIQRLLHRKLYL